VRKQTTKRHSDDEADEEGAGGGGGSDGGLLGGVSKPGSGLTGWQGALARALFGWPALRRSPLLLK
jgi:hypothetical protein